MANSVELERRFLVRFLPEGIGGCESKEMLDIYIPSTAYHPTLRLRKNGDRFVMTKKEPVADGDSSRQLEQTIPLREDEFRELSTLQGKRLQRVRYNYPCDGLTAEISVFKGAMEGLAMVDFEFGTVEEKDSFRPPDFCLAEVTNEDFLAAGLLCGKAYSDIEKELARFGYSRIA